MLYDIPSMKPLTQVPYGESYRPLREALDSINPSAFDSIHAELTSRFTESEIETSSWIPGAIWQGTPWYPIFQAAQEDQTTAAKFFGQIVWQVVMDLETCWSSGHYELNGVPIKGRTYFKINCP